MASTPPPRPAASGDSPSRSAPPAPTVWTTRKLQGWMTRHFTARGIESARVCADMLLSHVLGCDRMRLYMDVDRPAAPEELAKLRELTALAAAHHPVQYLVGHVWFFGKRFNVNPTTLIPRPSTQTLVETVLQRERAAPRPEAPVIADIGTGSGCIAISLALGLPRARIVATDIVPAALELARSNAAEHGVVERLDFIEGDALVPLHEHPAIAGRRYDYVVSNPPYISDAEWAAVEPNVKGKEPDTALRGGPDGLAVIRRIVTGASELLREDGMLLVEIAHSQHETAIALARDAGWGTATVLKDHENLWRVLVAQR